MIWQAASFCTPETERFVPLWEEMIRRNGGVPTVLRMAAGTPRPEAILRAAERTRSWFIFLDIDTLLEAPPCPPAFSRWDVGVTDNPDRTAPEHTAMSALVLNNSAGAMKFLSAWETLCRNQPQAEHPALTISLKTAKLDREIRVVDVSRNIVWKARGLAGDYQPPPPEVEFEPELPIVIAMATYPPRHSGMLRVVSDLLPQCDRFLLYANGYDVRPAGLPDDPRLEVLLAGPNSGNPDKGCQGKFHWVGEDDAYYLTVDDDIFYPSGYARFMAGEVERFGRKAIVGLHGGLFRVIPGQPIPPSTPHTRLRTILPYDRKVDRDTPVHTLGGGVMASHPRTIGLTSSVCGGPPNSGDDEDIAIWAQERRVPLVRVPGRTNWVLPNDTEWVKQPLHRNQKFLDQADQKIKSWKSWRTYPTPKC